MTNGPSWATVWNAIVIVAVDVSLPSVTRAVTTAEPGSLEHRAVVAAPFWVTTEIDVQEVLLEDAEVGGKGHAGSVRDGLAVAGDDGLDQRAGFLGRVRVAREEPDHEAARPAGRLSRPLGRGGARRVGRAGVNTRKQREEGQGDRDPAHCCLRYFVVTLDSGVAPEFRNRRIPLAVSLWTRWPETVWPKKVRSKAVWISVAAGLPVDPAVEREELIEGGLLDRGEGKNREVAQGRVAARRDPDARAEGLDRGHARPAVGPAEPDRVAARSACRRSPGGPSGSEFFRRLVSSIVWIWTGAGISTLTKPG